LSQQALALADNFKAVGFELGTLSSEGGWLALTVGTTFGISVSVLPIKQLTPLTAGQGPPEPVRPLPVKHLTAFQSVLLSLLLRANKTVAFLLGGKAEVGMIALKVDKLGVGIPQLVATVSVVSVTGNPSPQTSDSSKLGSAPPSSVDVFATPEQVEQLQHQLTEKLCTDGNIEGTCPSGPHTIEDHKGEAFIQEMEERHAKSPVGEGVGGHGPAVESAASPVSRSKGPQTQEIPASEQPEALDLEHPPAVVVPDPPSALRVIFGAGKSMGSLVSGGVQAAVGGLGKSLGAVQSLLHRGNNEEEKVKDVLTMGQTVGAQVRHHGFRLSYPDWLTVTIGTVVGCELCVEPIPQAEQAAVEQKGEAPTGQAAVLLKMFVKAVKSVENAAVTLQQNNASLNSLDLTVDNVGLGIPKIGVAINLNRK
jgi:hypothetical protein